jgi:cytochrome c-type biogenesis protein CcmF
MHLTAYLGLLFALLACLFLAGYAALAAWKDQDQGLVILERGFLLPTLLVLGSSTLLTVALLAKDYSFLYIYEHVDRDLSAFYTFSAFWAGREGSLLFWSLSMLLLGAIFALTPGYRSLAGRTKVFYWLFFLTVQAFFLLLLTCWTNPFIEVVPIPADGQGLNPLLQNPGMIFHPPLLFLGYAGFAIPACVAMAAAIAGEPGSWIRVCRNVNLLSWIFLTAGIVLGGWWSYMELGWGGYWAWDPVENASLIPWFSATAFLHTAHIEARRGALARTNVLLMALTFLLCVFGTYLVRSGVIESLHAFGEGGVGTPLMLFMLGGLAVALLAVLAGDKPVYRALSDMWSRQGLLLAASWFFLALGLVVAMATMWPVISKLWSATTVGLGPDFYNRVCVPLLSLLVLLFCLCPWLDWKVGLREKRGLLLTGAVFVLALVGFALGGVRKPVPLFSAAASVAAMAACVLLFVFLPQLRRSRRFFGAYGVHLAVALMALGIAFSGPYKVEEELALKPGQSVDLAGYSVTFVDTAQERTPALSLVRATLRVAKNGKEVGVLLPERRLYRNFPQPFAEAATIPTLGDELYATLLGFNDETSVSVKISVNPLVNWVWIGGTLLCLAPLLLLRRKSEA